MFPLWQETINIEKNSTLHPSQTQYFHISPICKLFSLAKKIQKGIRNKTCAVKGISPHSFCQGSMTVEASLVLPLFLFFFMNLLSFIEVYRFHSLMLSALRETGQQLSVYAYAYDEIVDEEEDKGLEALIENVAFSYIYVKYAVEEYLGKDYLERTLLTHGKEGISYLESSIMQQNDRIDLIVTYELSPFITMDGLGTMRLYNRYYGRAFTGYDLSEAAQEYHYVYVAENGKVYHKNRSCTHLALKISICSIREAKRRRNEDGRRYSACRMCTYSGMETVYICSWGDAYHGNKACSGLKRTIFVMPIKEATEKYPPCSRCGQ